VPIDLDWAFHPRLAYCDHFSITTVLACTANPIRQISLFLSRCGYDLLGCASDARAMNACSGNRRRMDPGKNVDINRSSTCSGGVDISMMNQ
jgi:hypothetical protein